MDRITFFLVLCLCATLSWAENGDWQGRTELTPDTWRGTSSVPKQPFGTIKDDGANNGKLSLQCDRINDNRLVGYRLYYGTETGVYTLMHDCKKTLETVCTVSGLTNSTTYYFVATAYGRNPAITSGYSNEVSGTP
jgi:hypothetical protein